MDSKIIFVIGTTGSGKSSLAFRIAKELNGEIINADALAIYKGADIMVAKANFQERNEVPHHLLDLCELQDMSFNRISFFNLAQKSILEIISRGKIPVVVGGTHYYIESLLFDLEIDEKPNFQREKNEFYVNDDANIPKPPSSYELLKKIDPLFTNKFHPNDSRRLESYFIQYLNTKVLPSDYIQKNENPDLRYKNSLVFWCFKNEKELSKSLKSRVCEMLLNNGFKEIRNVFDSFGFSESQKHFGKENFHGVLQSIGYKEFYDFYTKFQRNELTDFNILSNEERKVLDECIEKYCVSCLQFAKKQLKWIQNRIIKFPSLSNNVIKIDFSSKSLSDLWNDLKSLVLDLNSKNISESNEQSIQILNLEKVKKSLKNWKQTKCEACDRLINGEKEWDSHCKSRLHRKRESIQKKLKLN